MMNMKVPMCIHLMAQDNGEYKLLFPIISKDAVVNYEYRTSFDYAMDLIKEIAAKHSVDLRNYSMVVG